MIRRLLAWISLVPGRKVTVWMIDGTVRRGRVRFPERRAVLLGVERRADDLEPEFLLPPRWTATVRSRTDEGVSWVRGWTGPAADALRAAVALR